MSEPLADVLREESGFVARLEASARRLEGLAQHEQPRGLTEPDPGSDERWQALQVWAHMAEFVDYWRAEAESVMAAYDGDAVPFGRTKDDPQRIAAIEVGQREPLLGLAQRTTAAIGEVREWLARLGNAEWNAVGRHPTKGEMDLEAIVEEFIVGHLEEHVAQLDKLVADDEGGAEGAR
jgi:hypothetical protein